LYGWYVGTSPAVEVWPLGCDLLSLYSLDETARDLLAAGHPHRSWPKQVRTDSEKCPLTRTSHHPQAPGEAAGMHEYGSGVRTWQQALFIVQPDTLLRWHRELFRLYWKRRSKTPTLQPKVAAETIALIRQMAKDNRLWGAERIRGELLKLGIRVCKRTIQKYMRNVRTHQPQGQKWSTFLRTHAAQICACDFLQVTDLLFRPLFAFFIVELKSRKVIHVGVTRSPTDAWVAQQLREATPYGLAPKYLIRDNDSKFGPCFARVAKTSSIKILKTPVHAPRANAICERFLRSVRKECLDHLLILQEKQLQRVRKRVCRVFQPGTTASRDCATDS